MELELRPRKKSTTAEGGRSGDSSSDPIESALFFDAVPQELLDNVLRFLSLVPHAVNWDIRVRLIDVMELYRVNGGLGTFLSTRFHTLSVSKSTDGYHEHQSDKFDDICERSGNFLRTIVIGEGMYDEEKNGRDIVLDFRAACPNVRSLNVVEQLGRWASAFGTQLEKLDITSDMVTVAIPNYCPSLRKLNFLGMSFRESISSEGPFDDYDSILNGIDWEFIGSKLESLTLSRVSITDGELKRMRKHCGNLNHIKIRSNDTESKAIADFIVSYGDQLELVYVDFMPENELNLIAEGCKNARFHTAVFAERLLLPTLRILGPRLEKIYLLLEEKDIDMGEWTTAWNVCPKLENISMISFLTLEKARAIMDTPKHRLKRLQLKDSPFREEENMDSKMKEMVDRFSEGTKNIEIVDLDWEFGGGASHPFEKLIRTNKSCIRKFSLTVYGGPFPQPGADNLVKQLLDCPLLQEITFSGVS